MQLSSQAAETVQGTETNPIPISINASPATVYQSSDSESPSNQGTGTVSSDEANNTPVPGGMSSTTESQFHEPVSSGEPDSNGVGTCSTTDSQSYKLVSSFLFVPGLSGKPPDPVREERVLFHTERQ